MSASAPRWVAVDDGDASIHYTGTWTQDQGLSGFASASDEKLEGPAYNGTARWSQTAGDSLSFSFVGTQVYVNGGLNFNPTGNVATCFIDGKATDNVTALMIDSGIAGTNGNPLCLDGGLSDGPHTITLNLTSIGHDPTLGLGGVGNSTTPNRLWVDNILYTPSASVDLTKVPAVQYFPDAPDITFSSGWQPYTTSPSIQLTRQTNASLTFNFNGVSVAYYGQVLNDPSTSPSTASYSIDDQAPISFNLISYDDSLTPYDTPFFTAQVPAGSHKLTVMYTGNSDTNTRPLGMVYMIVQNSLAETSTTTQSSSVISSASTTGGTAGLSSLTPTSGTSGSLSGSSTTTSDATGFPNPTPGSDNVSHKANHTGVIVGAVVGGVAFLLLLALFLFLRRRKQRQWDNLTPDTVVKEYPDWTALPRTEVPTPFPLPPDKFRPQGEAAGNYPYETRQQRSQDATQGSISPFPLSSQPASGSSSSKNGSPINARNHPPSEVFVAHKDSGLRLPPPDAPPLHPQRVVDIPPSYSAM